MSLDEKFNDKITESLQSLFELSARIDERIKSLSNKHLENDIKWNKLTETQTKLLERIAILESASTESIKEEIYELKEEIKEINNKLHNLDIAINNLNNVSNNQENRWKVIFDVIVKIAVIVSAALIVYKLGIQ